MSKKWTKKEKELMRQFIAKRLAIQEFTQNNPEFEVIQTVATGVIICKN